MRRWIIPSLLLVGVVVGLSLFSLTSPVKANNQAQIPTINIATVTGTATGPLITVRTDLGLPSINVRSGPNSTYDLLGVLLAGQTAVAKGRSPGGTWFLIDYPGAPNGQGWVSGDYITLQPGTLPVVEPPPTATPLVTLTIDPTLAAQFVFTSIPTRLATYTPPAALSIPTFEQVSGAEGSGGIPMGLVIISLGAIGILFGILSILQRR